MSAEALSEFRIRFRVLTCLFRPFIYPSAYSFESSQFLHLLLDDTALPLARSLLFAFFIHVRDVSQRSDTDTKLKKTLVALNQEG